MPEILSQHIKWIKQIKYFRRITVRLLRENWRCLPYRGVMVLFSNVAAFTALRRGPRRAIGVGEPRGPAPANIIAKIILDFKAHTAKVASYCIIRTFHTTVQKLSGETSRFSALFKRARPQNGWVRRGMHFRIVYKTQRTYDKLRIGYMYAQLCVVCACSVFFWQSCTFCCYLFTSAIRPIPVCVCHKTRDVPTYCIILTAWREHVYMFCSIKSCCI